MTIAFKLADVKLESSEGYLLKLGKNVLWDFEVIYIFRKNAALNICRYLKGFDINKKTITFSPSLFIWYAKNHGNRLNLSF